MKWTLWIAIFLSFLASEARAQGANQPQNPQQIQLQTSPLSGEVRLTLAQAIELALERNPSLMVEKIRLEQARARIEQESGVFNWIFNARGSAARRENVVASRFFPTGLYVDAERSPSVGIEGKTSMGGKFTAAFDYRHLKSTSNTQTLSPQYSGNFVLAFSHALLRDFGSVNKTRIRVAEKAEAIAERTLAQRVAQLVQQVEETYWNLTYLREDLQEKGRSLNVAQGLLKRNVDLQRAGMVAQVNVLEALAGVASREENVITSESEVARLEDRLKVLLWLEPSTAHLTPVEAPQEPAATVELVSSLDAVLQRRPEVQALQNEVEQRQVELKYAHNQTRPRLDISAQYGAAGLAGQPNPTCVDPTSIFCQPAGDNVSGSVFAGKTQPQDVLTQMFNRHPFDNWSLELKLQVPLGNRTANAQYSEANLRSMESSTRLRALRAQIEQEIRDAAREMQTARKRLDAARETARFVQDQLDGARRKFDAGLASSYDVLQVLGEVDKARTTERKALMDYNVGRSKLRLAEASTLDIYNIDVKNPPRYVFNQINNVTQ
jgi:outer membrane protein